MKPAFWFIGRRLQEMGAWPSETEDGRSTGSYVAPRPDQSVNPRCKYRLDLEFWGRLPRMMQVRREFSPPRRIGNAIATWNK